MEHQYTVEGNLQGKAAELTSEGLLGSLVHMCTFLAFYKTLNARQAAAMSDSYHLQGHTCGQLSWHHFGCSERQSHPLPQLSPQHCTNTKQLEMMLSPDTSCKKKKKEQKLGFILRTLHHTSTKSAWILAPQ